MILAGRALGNGLTRGLLGSGSKDTSYTGEAGSTYGYSLAGSRALPPPSEARGKLLSAIGLDGEAMIEAKRHVYATGGR
jgi:hypothetical protein